MNLGPHASYIIASYAIVAVVLSALIAWLLYDGRNQRRILDDLERRGFKRRSTRDPSGTTDA